MVLNWTAVPYNMSVGGGGGYAYSVWESSTLSAGLANYHVLASGLTFNTTSGTYTDTNGFALGAQKCYRISSP